MSLILDALHRARQDSNPVPGLATHHPVAQMPVERRQLLVLMILGVALVVIVWLLMERFSARPAADIGAPVAELTKNIGSAVTSITTELQSRAATSAPNAAPAPAAAAQAPAAAAPVTPTAPATPAPQSASVEAAQQVATPQATVPTAAPQSETPVLSTQETEAVAELYQNQELQKDPILPEPAVRPAKERVPDDVVEKSVAARAKQDVDLDKILQQAREELENASLIDHSTPFLADLSQQVKDDIPTIYYQRHDYSSTPNQSSVVLNGTTLNAGASPLPGMKLEEILPDSVVLNYRGTRFRLRAMNSWVNL